MNKKIDRLLQGIKAAAMMYDADKVKQLSGELVQNIQSDIAAHPQGFIIALNKAVSVFNRKEAESLCDQLVLHLYSRKTPYPSAESKKILGLLRRKRYVDLMSRVADVLIQTGQDKPVIRRQYAQALIDQGYISAALDVLLSLEQHCLEIEDVDERVEARGLIGRARKQVYMDAAADKRPGKACSRNLLSAISDYAGVYEKSKQHI